MADVSNAVKCTNVVLNGFTVPAGQALVLPLLEGTTVNMCKIIFSACALNSSSLADGNILFGNKTWAGPLFTVR